MAVPVVLLDIDGVVNALAKKPPTDVWDSFRHDSWIIGKADDTGGRSFPMMIARQVVWFFNELHASGAAEVRWHTTWQWAASNVAELAGFDPFKVADAPEFANYRNYQKQAIMDGRPTWWKLPAAERVVQEELRDLIWIDDDLPYELTRKSTFDPTLGGKQRVCLIAPYGVTGLVKHELKQVSLFLEACAKEDK